MKKLAREEIVVMLRGPIEKAFGEHVAMSRDELTEAIAAAMASTVEIIADNHHDIITLDEARAVIDAHHAEENAKHLVEAKKLVGRYFKRPVFDFEPRPSGLPRQAEPWSRYVAITAVSDTGQRSGWSFEQSPGGVLTLYLQAPSADLFAPEEVTAHEFWTAAAAFVVTIQQDASLRRDTR